MFARHSLQGMGKDVLYNTVKQRFGKKMPGISSHFDHPTGHHMMGQQLLTLGLSCGDGFVPLDNELRNFSYKKYWNHVFSRQVDIYSARLSFRFLY